MKITTEDFNTLKTALFAASKTAGVQPNLINSQRCRWDLLAYAGSIGLISINALYDRGYNDDHLDTAMRKIFKVEQTA